MSWDTVSRRRFSAARRKLHAANTELEETRAELKRLRSALAALAGVEAPSAPEAVPQTRPSCDITDAPTVTIEHGVTFANTHDTFELAPVRSPVPLTGSEISEMTAIRHSFDRPCRPSKPIQPTHDDLMAFDDAAAATETER